MDGTDPNRLLFACEGIGGTILVFASDFWHFLLAFVVIGLANGFYSGADLKIFSDENRSNPWIHEFSTGAEINHQLQRAGIETSTPLYLVGSVGTGGSLHGIYRALKKNFNHVKIALTSPKELPYGSLEHPNGLPKFAGSGGLGEGRKQTFIHELEEEVIASYEYSYSEALEGCARYYDQTHQFIGSSSGANYLASLDLSHKLTAGVIVTLFPGGADTNEQAKIRSQSRTCEP